MRRRSGKLTVLMNGAAGIRSIEDFWYFLISRRATVPGLNLCVLFVPFSVQGQTRGNEKIPRQCRRLRLKGNGIIITGSAKITRGCLSCGTSFSTNLPHLFTERSCGTERNEVKRWSEACGNVYSAEEREWTVHARKCGYPGAPTRHRCLIGTCFTCLIEWYGLPPRSRASRFRMQTKTRR